MAGRRVVQFLLLAVVLLFTACRFAAVPGTPPSPERPAPEVLFDQELPPDAQRWVSSTLESLDLRRKAAQMVMVRVFGRYLHPRSEDYLRILAEVRDLEVGGLIVSISEIDSLPRLLDRLQEEAPLPLLVAADVERGMAFRIPQGTVPLPYAMAVGATRSEATARFTGRVTAREGRALGIHWAFAPVTDVNVNPANPVIHVRSYGEDPELVARLAAAYIHGVREGGMMATAKHFPGHGDTVLDSHYALPTVDADRERLEAVELLPFRRAVDAGVDAVMTGHLAVPALDPSATPATLSVPIVDGLLRRQMGFEGLIITDAMVMEGVGGVWVGAATVRAVEAGSDVILMPPDVRVAIDSIVRAVEEGELSEARLDASVRRILEAKARFGLHRERRIGSAEIERHVADPEDVEKALAAARASITVVRNQGDVLPVRAEEDPYVFHLSLLRRQRWRTITDVTRDELEQRGVRFTHRTLLQEVSPEAEDTVVDAARTATHIVVSAFSARTLTDSQLRLLRRLNELEAPLVLISLGSPYLLAQIPEVPVYVCTYGPPTSSQQAALGAVFGEYPVRGKLPVTLPGLYDYGHGLEIPRHAMTLRRALPREAGFRSGLEEVDRVLDAFVAEKAFPGGVVAVGRGDALVHLRAFGRHSYDDDAPAVSPRGDSRGGETATDTIYDLASLTKVVATTTMAMILADEGRLALDAPVDGFLPKFKGPGKEKVTVRHLLTHSSGVDWWAPLYEELEGQRAYVERIQAMDLVYEPGSKTMYSDLGLILLGEILERVSGQTLDAFVEERVFAPLGMTDTRFRPGEELRARIAPTEHDAAWRGRLVHGEVHDENAHAMGGVAPHAGLFSTASDLARFVLMIRNGGVFEHHRLISRQTVEAFTRRAGIVPGSTRALGWDTRSAERSSAGTLFSPSSFGHTGFTGTSIWIDPERELFVILLTNRVHPTRENKLIRRVRPAVADAVVRALEGS